MTPDALRVVVADDHPFYRRGLARAIRALGMEVVAEAFHGEGAIEAVEETAPDVVVMDLKMPRMSGLEATRVLSERQPALRVMVLSVSADDDDVKSAALAGARGYVLKERPLPEIVEAIRACGEGRPCFSPEIALPLLRGLVASAGGEVDGATASPPGLRPLLDLVAAGAPDRAIATALGVDDAVVRERAATLLSELQHLWRVHEAAPRHPLR